jgi:hypothetical protein
MTMGLANKVALVGGPGSTTGQATVAIAKDIKGFAENPAYSGVVFCHEVTTA